MKKERLDKIISSQSMMTRSDASRLIKGGCVKINGAVVKNTSFKVDTENDSIELNGEPFVYKEHVYIMMNKPSGIVSASRDPKEKTVVDIVPEELMRPGLFPAGRLDKDTTGFVLITDDGDFAHNILAPKHHIEKTYLAKTDVIIEETYLESIRSGMTSGEDVFMPAQIELYENDDTPVYKIILHEGKYHEIKRMIGASNAVLLSLKRIKMGMLDLDEALQPGECREITAEELLLVQEKIPCR
ncbi:MAG: rRNA pseudouridine synthase [Clostridia bacterium]|nr:rRNA pseudouridine synthase [Clostridia bacterium]